MRAVATRRRPGGSVARRRVSSFETPRSGARTPQSSASFAAGNLVIWVLLMGHIGSHMDLTSGWPGHQAKLGGSETNRAKEEGDGWVSGVMRLFRRKWVHNPNGGVQLVIEPIDDLVFYPWKGPRYMNSIFGIRILVMGESTYLGPNESWEQYDDLGTKLGGSYFVVHDILAYREGEGDWRISPFWTKMINGLLGRRMYGIPERREVLDSIAYWNYGDGQPLAGHSRRPSKDVLSQSNGKLRKVIARLRPDLVVFMSRRLWSNLSQGDCAFATDPNAVHGTVCKSHVDGVEFRFLSICHPRHFSIERDWRAIRCAIKECHGRQP